MAGQRESVDRRLEALEQELDRLRAEAASAKRRSRIRRPRLRSVAVLAGVLALTITGVSIGVTGEPLRLSQRTPATGNATAETVIASDNAAGYTLRAANNNAGDGGALGGTCRATPANEACLTAFNLNGGRAFDFTSAGSLGGRITVSGAGAKPFTTNATGVADGLNADKVDGKDASELQGAQGPQGERGPTGEQGPKGEKGDKGDPGGISGVQVGEACAGTCNADYYSTYLEAWAGCPYGTKIVGGGFYMEPGRYSNGTRYPVQVQRSSKLPGYDYWVVGVNIQSLSFMDLKVQAICV